MSETTCIYIGLGASLVLLVALTCQLLLDKVRETKGDQS